MVRQRTGTLGAKAEGEKTKGLLPLSQPDRLTAPLTRGALGAAEDGGRCCAVRCRQASLCDSLRAAAQCLRAQWRGSALPPSDEGGGFCEAKDGGRENVGGFLIFLSPSQKSEISDNCLRAIRSRLWLSTGQPFTTATALRLPSSEGAVGAAEDGGRENERFTTPQSGSSPDSSP